jgi:hypothetical protein
MVRYGIPGGASPEARASWEIMGSWRIITTVKKVGNYGENIIY